MTIALFVTLLCSPATARDLNAELELVAATADFNWLHELRGIQPEHYTQRRRPEPEVAAELRRRQPDPLAMAAMLMTRRYPAHLDGAERDALTRGLIVALGHSQHPRAAEVLIAVVRDDRAGLGQRALATEALGMAGDRAALEGILSDRGTPVALKTGATRGLGYIKSHESLEVLAVIARHDDPALRRAAATSLGFLASRWSTRSVAGGEALRREASRVLLSVLPEPSDREMHRAVVDALAMIGHPSSFEVLAAHAPASHRRLAGRR